MKDFVRLRHPGLYPKLSWFYNKYVGNGKAPSKEDFKKDEFSNELFERFPGFEEIHRFRNDVAHGVIDKSLANLKDAKRLRCNAKDIVSDLFDIAESASYNIPGW